MKRNIILTIIFMFLFVMVVGKIEKMRKEQPIRNDTPGQHCNIRELEFSVEVNNDPNWTPKGGERRFRKGR